MIRLIPLLLLLLVVSTFSSCKAEDFATPDERDAIVQLEAQKSILESALDAGGLTPEAVAEITDQIAVLDAALFAAEKEIAGRSTSGWFDWLPLGPLAPFKEVIAGLATLAFPRVRSNLKKGVKAVSKGDWRNALLSPLRLVGAVHTNNDPIDIMIGAAASATSEGNHKLAQAILDQAEELIKRRKYPEEYHESLTAPSDPDHTVVG